MTAWARTDNDGVDSLGMVHGRGTARHKVWHGEATSYGTRKGWPGTSDDGRDHGAA